MAAARRLKISQPTMGRRIAALEQELGSSLFTRSARGLAMTETGEAILEHARRMESEALSVGRIAGGADQELTGRVRISSAEGLCVEWLIPLLIEFHRRYPAVILEIVASNEALNLLRREADIALRLFRPKQVDLIALKLAALPYGLFASRDYLARHGTPRTRADLRRHRAVAAEESLMRLNQAPWQRFESLFEAGNIVFRSNSFPAQEAAVRAGFGIGAMPLHTGRSAPELVPVLAAESHFAGDLWLVAHSDLRRNARIRAAFDFIAERGKRDRAWLAGRRVRPAPLEYRKWPLIWEARSSLQIINALYLGGRNAPK